MAPTCGALWGITTQEPTNAALAAAERSAGRRYDIVYRFHDIDDEMPTAEEKQLVAQGRLLHVSVDARLFGGDQVSWADVADGRYDSTLVQQARGLAALKAPVFMTFEHEADQQAKTSQGSGADFNAAWRHVHAIYDREGATNAIWVWVMMGTPASIPRAERMWPGNDVVDWISWDVYNPSGCRAGRIDPKLEVSFEQAARPFYDWLVHAGADAGIDTGKPMMISETGTVVYPDDPQRAAAWYAAIPGALERLKGIKAVSLWDHTGQNLCDYRFSNQPKVQQAVAKVGRRALLNPRLPSR
jgi:hypothetical protein